MEKPERQNFPHARSINTPNLQNSIELTTKAFNFVEGRKQELTTSQYVSMILENLYEYSNQQSVSVDDQNIVDIVEGKRFTQDVSLFDKYQASRQSGMDTARHAIDILRKTYGDRIPLFDFYELCRRFDLADDEIELEAKRFSAFIVTPDEPLDQNILDRANGIYDYLRSVFGNNVPIDIFKTKCLERGVTPGEFESIKNRYGYN